MKKSVIVVFSCVVLRVLNPCCATTLSEIVAGVSVNSYSNFHNGLFVSDGNSRGFTDGDSPRVPAFQHDLARDFIHSNFTAMGFDTWLDPFEFNITLNSSNYTYQGCNNVVAIKWGNEGTNVYIVGAHYDSIDHGHRNVTLCPGADDNASGTAAILEAARAIKDYVFRDTIVIIAFDAEEKDYKGSINFVNNHITTSISETNATTFLKSNIKAMVNLDTIAYDDTNTSHRVVIGRVSSLNPVAKSLYAAVTDYTSLIPYHSSGYNESDHKIFQSFGIASVHLIEYDFDTYFLDAGKNPHYHSDEDSIGSPGYISYEYATEITKAVVGAVCDNAGIIPPATLALSIAGGSKLELSWFTAPDVSYALYGAHSMMQTNPWTFLEFFPPTNETAEYSIQLDLGTVTQTVFKVESY